MHTDPDLLALLALGEDIGDEPDHRHAKSCPTCAAELAHLQQVVRVGRSVREDDVLLTPRDDVWTRIRSELDLEAALLPSETVEAPRAAQGVRAHAHLTPVGASWAHASGTAELSTDAHGRRILQVALHADLPRSGVRQAWLIHRDDPSRRQTLGILDGAHGLWTVDHSVDLEQYAILDISQQGLGETEHSGQSLVRGELTLVG